MIREGLLMIMIQTPGNMKKFLICIHQKDGEISEIAIKVNGEEVCSFDKF